ncbi:MAG: carbon-nitrogen hydrolase family protein [Gammaproteobacteria bacterium]|nr:MAG: carbon-nitrogen hydrolase family protein [Gammaproteobacteria bacterium]
MTSGEDRERNLRDARALVREAAAAGARLAVLPENFALMSADERRRWRAAEPDGHGPIQDALADMAAASGVWLVGGSLPIAAAQNRPPASACCVYDPGGRRRARYDKIHLFDVDVPGSGERYRESATTTPGELPVALDTPWGRLGLAVCYDLRFPELFRQLSEQGAEIFAVPAAFTRATGRAHWDVLLRARAIENLAHVIAAAQAGTHPGGRRTWGHTAIVEPWGEIVAQRASAPGVVLAELDPQRTRRLREQFPALQHRRLGGKDRDDGRN